MHAFLGISATYQYVLPELLERPLSRDTLPRRPPSPWPQESVKELLTAL